MPFFTRAIFGFWASGVFVELGSAGLGGAGQVIHGVGSVELAVTVPPFEVVALAVAKL
jgi:hypothetical protein